MLILIVLLTSLKVMVVSTGLRSSEELLLKVLLSTLRPVTYVYLSIYEFSRRKKNRVYDKLKNLSRQSFYEGR